MTVVYKLPLNYIRNAGNDLMPSEFQKPDTVLHWSVEKYDYSGSRQKDTSVACKKRTST